MRLLFHGSIPEIDWDDPDLRLTDAQKQAMATDREVAVLAGAGTGKTHTLALRYVALLLALASRGESDVERVLVLTFTEKAAQEMAERCHGRLVALATAARRAEHPVADPLERMVDGFDRARIGTFHSFCARLVHELGAAPPGSRPLDPSDAAPLTEEVLSEALDALLAGEPEALWPLLDTFGTRRGLLQAGQIALDRWSVLEEVVGRYADGAVRLDDRLAAARPTAAEAAEWLASVGFPSLHLLIRLVAPSGGGPFVDGALRPAFDALRADADPDPLAVYGRYRDALDLLLTEAGTLRRLDHHTVLGRREAWPDDRRYRLAKDGAVALTQRLGDWEARARRARTLPTRADRALLDGLAPFGRWIRAASQLLRARLDADRTLTFEEIQRRAIRAVNGQPEVRAKVRERFRYLMVDELQDTDEAQWSLILALGRADPAIPEDRIFVVGDPKQAIYGFRGGDVTVFGAAVRALSGHVVALDQNFRSRPGLIDWFNGVFPTVLPADHRPLVAGRNEPGGRVWWVDTAESAESAARWVAGAIGPESPWSDRERHPTPPIAILLRARTRQGAIEAALRRWEVPYVVIGGVGFWARPEILDVVNLVAAVAHGDPISLVGVLRSPVGGLPDEAIDPPNDAVLAPWRALHHTVTPASFVRRAAEHLLPGYAALGEPTRTSANLDRLCGIVDGWAELSLAEVADRLVQRVEGQVREAEATLVATEARVVLCTVHASKGLEFPVVVVPELERRARGSRPPLLVARADEGVALDIAARVLDPDADVETRVEPGQYRTLSDAIARAEDAEERRLLYVALTRARDELVLVGASQTPAEPGARSTWMQLVEASLPRTTLRLSEVPEPTGSASVVLLPPPLAAARPVPRREALVVSASTLHAFAACPARWKRAAQLRIPEGPTVLLPAARGRVLHGVLQDGEHNPAAIRRRYDVEATWAGATEDERERGFLELMDHLSRTRSAPGVQRALAANGRSEVPFRVRHGPIVLQGRIDRLWQDADGAVVLDWKSEALAGRSPAELAAAHRPQWLSYAWAASHHGPVARAELVLTSTGHVEALPVDTAAREVPALLDAVLETALSSWSDVEAASVRTPRPCDGCRYRGRGCRGT